MCFLHAERGRKIAIECYTSQLCTIAYPLLDHAGVFCSFFSCLNTQCKQGQQNKVLKNFCVSCVCVCVVGGGGGGGGGGRGPPGPSPGSATVAYIVCWPATTAPQTAGCWNAWISDPSEEETPLLH